MNWQASQVTLDPREPTTAPYIGVARYLKYRPHHPSIVVFVKVPTTGLRIYTAYAVLPVLIYEFATDN
jgi:hypothetical protein